MPDLKNIGSGLKWFSLGLILLLIINLNIHCSNSSVSGEPRTSVEDLKERQLRESSNPESIDLLKKVSTYNDGKEILITLFVSDTLNWLTIKEQLVVLKKELLDQFPDTKTISLVGYTDLEKTPIVKKNPILAWNHEVNQYRACAIDNAEGKWRFSYGGTKSKEDGNWNKTEWLD